MKKSEITKQQWTSFWQSFDISIKKPDRFLRNYKFTRDQGRLNRLGVSRTSVDRIKKGFSKYQGPEIQFHKFVVFFIRDFNSIKKLIGTRSISKAFEGLFQRLHYSSLNNAKKSFLKPFLLYKYNEKGWGDGYIIRGSRVPIKSLDGVVFSRLLNVGDRSNKYRVKAKFNDRSSTVIVLTRDLEGERKKVYKFIRLFKSSDGIEVNISVDSPKELRVIRNKLTQYFNAILDKRETAGSLDKFWKFIKSGESDHFVMTGISFYDRDFKVSVYPIAMSDNVSPAVKSNFSRLNQRELDKMTDLRLLSKEAGRLQVYIRFRTFMTDGVIDAFQLIPNDRRLNLDQRKNLNKAFKDDFSLSFGQLVRLKNSPDKDIYKAFLRNVPKKENKFELHSDRSVAIYKKLISNGLISQKTDVKEVVRFCYNRSCMSKYRVTVGRKHCGSCGEWLLGDRAVIIKRINEDKIAGFIFSKLKGLNFDVRKFNKKLLGRKIFVVQASSGKKSISFIPITRDLNDNQLKVLKFRIPDSAILTSKNDLRELKTAGLEAIETYDLIYDLFENKDLGVRVKALMGSVARDGLAKLRSLSGESVSRLKNGVKDYSRLNKVSGHLGAELFEADCAVLLGYVFGNSIWLGANERGSKYPDGITALPATDSKNGCFIWDSKLSEGKGVRLGKDKKNLGYIDEGKKNKTIKENGHLKGFVFIGNVEGPKNFVSKYNKVFSRRRFKMMFMLSEHLVRLFEHYQDNEQDFQRSRLIREIFYKSMQDLFFKISGGNKALVIDDSIIDKLLKENTSLYSSMPTKSVAAA